MAYALLQQTIDAPTLDQVRTALKQTIDLNLPVVPADASGIINDSFGVLVQKLNAIQAERLQAAFSSVGYETIVVDEQDIFDLPPVKQYSRIDPTDQAMVLYDLYGRAQSVAWPDVLVVACGLIGKVKTVQHEEVVSQTSDGAALTMVRFEEVKSQDMTLEMLLACDPMRVRINPHACNYAYLGDRRSDRSEENFFRLVGDIAGRAQRAVLNRGTRSIIAATNTVAVYPFQKSFNEELSWTVWHATYGQVD